MPIDAALAQRLRDDLGTEAVAERRMFGGLCFLSRGGHMICGLHKAGTMYRIGKDNSAQALALPGARPMRMGGRTMAAMVELSLQDSARDDLRRPLIALALATVRRLPPKVAKPPKG